jgi:hypothetical protein
MILHGSIHVIRDHVSGLLAMKVLGETSLVRCLPGSKWSDPVDAFTFFAKSIQFMQGWRDRSKGV